MRIFKAFLTVLILVSCDKEVKNFKPQSSGRINSISVIIDKPSWDGKIGDAIRDKYASEFIGLPQVEEAFTLNYIPYEAFTGFGRTARNVIYINKKKQDKPRMIRDRYARPQLFLEVSGLDNESIIQGISSSFEFSSAQFQNGEITENKNRILNSLLKDTGLDSLNISLKIPSAYSVFKNEPETVWLQKPLKNGTSNLIIKDLNSSVSDFEKINLNDVVSLRDSIGKEFIPGRVENSYMITEKEYLPYISYQTVNGFEAIETRGTWEVKGDYMGGPFINYIIKDTLNNSLLYVEGFVFSPSQRKRDKMIELEAVIKSMVIGKR
ncbi:MAG: DUF4837 family protein [Bacteroidota bacterium]